MIGLRQCKRKKEKKNHFKDQHINIEIYTYLGTKYEQQNEVIVLVCCNECK